MNKIFSCFLAMALLASACRRVPDTIEPKINYAVQDRYLKRLPSPFKPLSPLERSQAWGIEYTVGLGFARQLDLYQAITAFKRAEILIPPENKERKLEIQYEILLSYYMGKKYQDVIDTYENSDLRFIDQNFPACEDMLIILHEAFIEEKKPEKAKTVLDLLNQYYPKTGEKLTVSSALMQGDIHRIRRLTKVYPEQTYLKTLLNDYQNQKKSVGGAQALNAILPGAGYFYVRQRQSAVTAFLLNGLFIATAVYFYTHKNYPAGIVFTSFEAGWYFGGIYGAGHEAKLYNERTYEKLATPLMNQKDLFPVLMLQHAF